MEPEHDFARPEDPLDFSQGSSAYDMAKNDPDRRRYLGVLIGSGIAVLTMAAVAYAFQDQWTRGNPAQLFGRMCGAFIWSLVPILFLDRALNARTRSLRLANLALCFGLLFLCLPEFAFDFGQLGRGLMGGLRLFLAAAGCSMAIFALVFRIQDQGTGYVRPILAILFCGFHALVGLGMLVLAVQYAQLPVAGDPATTPHAWVFKHPDADVQVRLPSKQWREVPNDKGWKTFVHPSPRMQLSILETHSGNGIRHFRAEVAALRATLDRSTKSPLTVWEASTLKGDLYGWIETVESPATGKEVYAVVALVWFEKKNVVMKMIFEGVTQNLSEMGRKSERQAFQRHAEYLVQSLE